MSGQNGKYNIHSISTDGSGKGERLTQGPNPQAPTSISPSGDTLFFEESDPSTGRDLWELSLSRKEARPLVKTRSEERFGALSSDQRWFAYQSNDTGRPEVYVQAYPGPGVKRRVSSDGGTSPFWSRTGRELFYSTATAMLSVQILDGEDLRLGPTVRLFTLTALDAPARATSADDQRFLTVQAHPSSQLNLVENWFDELRRLVPMR
jgi:Tol biopolymer transport system component